jgi:hypothetical protein
MLPAEASRMIPQTSSQTCRIKLMMSDECEQKL